MGNKSTYPVAKAVNQTTNIRCVVFDFDGTLVRSNRIKKLRLYDTVADIPRASIVLDALHSEDFKGDRYDIFRELCRRLDLKTDDQADRLAHIYGELCHQSLIECSEVPGASVALEELRTKGVPLYIVSATPQINLLPAITARALEPYFKGVLGRPIGKIEHVRAIMEFEQLDSKSLVIVGDGRDDLDTAAAVKCHFIAVNDDPLEPLTGDHIAIHDLTHLTSALNKLGNHQIA